MSKPEKPLSLGAAQEKALVIARGDPQDVEEQDSIRPFVENSAVVKDNQTWYRVFEAAASWLGSDPYRFVKAEKGVTFEDMASIKAELRERQRLEDVRLGLVEVSPITSYAFPGVAR